MPFDGPLPAFEIAADFWSLRFVDERSEHYAVRKNVPMPLTATTDRGAMATVYAHGGYGYAATSDTSQAGLQAALDRAARWARATAHLGLVDTRSLALPAPAGSYESPGFAVPAGPATSGTSCSVRNRARRASIHASSIGRRTSTCAPRRTGW